MLPKDTGLLMDGSQTAVDDFDNIVGQHDALPHVDPPAQQHEPMHNCEEFEALMNTACTYD